MPLWIAQQWDKMLWRHFGLNSIQPLIKFRPKVWINPSVEVDKFRIEGEIPLNWKQFFLYGLLLDIIRFDSKAINFTEIAHDLRDVVRSVDLPPDLRVASGS